MRTVIEFSSCFEEPQVVRRLAQADSGFELSTRRELDSAIVDGFAIGGVIVGIAQLAVSIVSLRLELKQAAAEDTTTPQVEVRVRDGSGTHIVPDGTTAEVEHFLEKLRPFHSGPF